MTGETDTSVRGAVEAFLYLEAALLDDWDLDAWLDLMCDDATYLVPPNEAPDSDPDDHKSDLINLTVTEYPPQIIFNHSIENREHGHNSTNRNKNLSSRK